jgi:hypothetical protein
MNTELCPHGMPLAENVCGPCSQGRPNQPAEFGFGITILAKMVRERQQLGHSQEAALDYIIDYAELRSEAIEQLRLAVQSTGAK